jgi:hypothetical protein
MSVSCRFFWLLLVTAQFEWHGATNRDFFCGTKEQLVNVIENTVDFSFSFWKYFTLSTVDFQCNYWTPRAARGAVESLREDATVRFPLSVLTPYIHMSDPANNPTVIWFQISIRPQTQSLDTGRARKQPKHNHPPNASQRGASCTRESILSRSWSGLLRRQRAAPTISCVSVQDEKCLWSQIPPWPMNQTNVEKNAGMYALCVDGTHGEMYHVQDNEGLKLALGYHQHELNIHEWRAFSVLYSFDHNRKCSSTSVEDSKGGKQFGCWQTIGKIYGRRRRLLLCLSFLSWEIWSKRNYLLGLCDDFCLPICCPASMRGWSCNW